jgi:hypothetical protein
MAQGAFPFLATITPVGQNFLLSFYANHFTQVGTAFAFKTAALELAFDYKGISFKGSINSLVLNIFPG